MSHANWYFAADDRQHGPFPFADLIARVRSGLIRPDTLVWTESLQHWTPAHAVSDLCPHFIDAPAQPLIPVAPLTVPIAESSPPPIIEPPLPTAKVTADVAQIRPWVRYFARITDITIVSCAAFSVLTLFSGELTTLQEMSLNFLTGLAWAIMEPLLLITFGTTPSKWLFGITLVSTSGTELTSTQAINRSITAWVFGTGLFLPLLSMIMLIISYFDLIQHGSTRWDRANGVRVVHEEIGLPRVGLIILLYCGIMTIVIVSAIIGVMIQA